MQSAAGVISAHAQREILMTDSNNPLLALSAAGAQLVERAAKAVVAVQHGGRGTISGVHWRSGVIVTAEEMLEQEKDIAVTLPGGRQVTATLAGRDPSTDVAVLRVAPDGLAVAETADAAALRPGHLVLAVGNHAGAPLASLGMVAYVGGAWHSMRGGTIDSFLRLDLALNPAGEGGAVIDAQGRVLGMTVTGPRRRVLAIPTSTIDRAVDQLLAKGYVGRGYLGAGLQHARLPSDATGPRRAGVLIASLDPQGPAARAGLLVGDVITAWGETPVERTRDVMRLLGPDSVGKGVELKLVRGGAPSTVKITIGERPLT
jgi:S1-C subfamily serine protease